MSVTRHPPDVLFLEECRPLSITARAMLAALVFERFCVEQDVGGPEIDAILSHHWAWLDVVRGAAEFSAWERAQPALPLRASRALVAEHRFRTVLEQVAATLRTSFYGAAEDEETFRSLQSVVERARPSELPPVTPFKFSRFHDGNGWGEPLTIADRDYWRTLRLTYARSTSA